MLRRLVLLALVGCLVVSVAARAAPPRAALDGMTVADHQNLERNLRWILARERAATAARRAARPPAVAVVADAGCWHVGARSVVQALEADGLTCRVLDATALTEEGLRGVQGIVIPGGWAYYIAGGLGEGAAGVVRSFVENGGTCLGICAGAFLLARSIAWEGARYDYGYGLFDGVAEGPLAALAAWPQCAAVRLTLSDAGRKRGLAAWADEDTLYYGGPRLLEGTNVEVLATYPDGSAAVVSRHVGKGEVVLSGPHPERSAPTAAGDGDPAPPHAGPILRALLGL